MRLLHVTIEGVGRFGTQARLEGLGAGVNILSAHNEAGKSTMFRAIRACLFERHNTTRDEVRQLATEGLALPVKVTLGFEHQGETYQLEKSFLRSPSATLARNGIEIARNREADETVWELFGISPGKTVDLSTYGVLWVEQGQSFKVPEPSEAAALVLNNVIQQEVGTLVGGERARQLLKDVKEALGKLLTDTGKPKAKGPIDTAQRHHEAIELQRIEAEKRLNDLDANLEKLGSLRTEFIRLNDPAEAQRLAAELRDAETAFKAADEAAQSLIRLESDERQAFKLLTAQQEALAALQERAVNIDKDRTRFNGLSADLDSLYEASEETASALAKASSHKTMLDREADLMDAEDLKLQRMSALSHKAATRDILQTRLALLRSFDARQLENEQALKSANVGDAALKALVDIERDIESISTRMESAAARLTIDINGGTTVRLNGNAISSHLSRAITEPLTVTINDDVTMTISPPASSLATADAAQREQQARLRALFARHGVSSASELRQLRAERAELEEAARTLKAEQTALGLKDASAATEIMRLQIEIRQLDSETQKALAELGSDTLPSPDALAQQRELLQDARAELKAKRAEAAAIVESLSATANRNAQARAALTGQIRELEARIAADLLLLPDDRRQHRLDAAGQEVERHGSIHRTCAALLAERRQTTPGSDDLDRLRLRAERLKRASENRARDIGDLRERIATLTGQVQTAGGDGLGERVAELQAESALALSEAERQIERANVLQLLRNVVETAYEKRREQLNAPLYRHLRPFLQDVFPQAEIALGDGFSVEGLKRSGPGSEIFGRLSSGTQEQIAVLVRLAMGAMIAEKGHDVPIILDDALVFSDDARIEQMFDAINRAGRNQQVIVLTCRARSFASLGGNQLRIT